MWSMRRITKSSVYGRTRTGVLFRNYPKHSNSDGSIWILQPGYHITIPEDSIIIMSNFNNNNKISEDEVETKEEKSSSLNQSERKVYSKTMTRSLFSQRISLLLEKRLDIVRSASAKVITSDPIQSLRVCYNRIDAQNTYYRRNMTYTTYPMMLIGKQVINTSVYDNAGNPVQVGATHYRTKRCNPVSTTKYQTYRASASINSIKPAYSGEAANGPWSNAMKLEVQTFSSNTVINFTKAFGSTTDHTTTGLLTLPLLRLWGYLLSTLTMGEYDIDTIIHNSCTDEPNWVAPALSDWYPFTQYCVNVRPAMQARIVTIEDFAQYVAGTRGTVLNWEASGFGTRIAVVFIEAANADNADTTAWWTLAHTLYPYRRMTYVTDGLETDNFQPSGNLPGLVTSEMNQVVIDGPSQRVLYVMNTTNSQETVDLRVGIGGPVVTMQNNYLFGGGDIDVGPGLSASHLAYNISSVLGAIDWWKYYYGCKKSYDDALISIAELAFCVPTPLMRYSNNSDRQLYSYYDDGSQPPTAPASNPVGGINFQQQLDGWFGSITTPLGQRSPTTCALVTDVAPVTHLVAPFPWVMAVAVAARLYFPEDRNVKDFPANPANMIFIAYRMAYVMASYVDYCCEGAGLDDTWNGGLLRHQNSSTYVRMFQSEVTKLTNALGSVIVPYYSTNLADTPKIAFRNTNIVYPFRRISSEASDFWFPELKLSKLEPYYTFKDLVKMVGTNNANNYIVFTGYKHYDAKNDREQMSEDQKKAFYALLSCGFYDENIQHRVAEENNNNLHVFGVPTNQATMPYRVWYRLSYYQSVGIITSSGLVPPQYGEFPMGCLPILIDNTSQNSMYYSSSGIKALVQGKTSRYQTFYWNTLANNNSPDEIQVSNSSGASSFLGSVDDDEGVSTFQD